MTVKIQIRRGTAAEWTSANPTLLSGEQGLETDTGKTKIGDGVTAWNSLGYVDAKFLASSASATFVPNSLIQDKSKIAVGNGSSVVALAAGADGTVLTANSGTSTGLEWAAVGGGKDDADNIIATQVFG